MRKYTDEQIEFLKNNVTGTLFKDLTVMYNQKYGTDLSVKAISSLCKRHGFKNGLIKRFKPGMTPYNKGVPMSKEQYIKAAPTMFKKGNKPLNTDPIGTEKLLADGYVYIKIDNQPKAKKSVNWKQKHRLIYEKEVGPIPDGYFVMFADGNKLNFDVSNLVLISASEKAVMAKFNLYYKDAESTKTGLNVAKLILATSKRKKTKKKENSNE